jgi:hypothetical protein
MGVLDKVEAVGWKFLGGSSVLLAAPGVWLGWQITNDSLAVPGRVMTGLIIAVLTAAVFTFIVNDLLHRRNVRRYEAAIKNMPAKAGKSGKRTK